MANIPTAKPAVHKQNSLLIWFVAIGAILVIATLTIASGLYRYQIIIHPDESRFLDLARSIAQNRPFTVDGLPSDFQKIGYPIALLPAILASNDTVTQLTLIRILNAIYVSLSIIPITLIAKRLFDKTAHVIILLICSPFLIGVTNALNILSECLYTPIALTILYLSWVYLDMAPQRKKTILAFILGLTCWITYLIKEISVLLLAAVMLVTIAKMIQAKKPDKPELINMLIMSVAFIVPFMLLKLTLFAGMPNSYSQFNIEALSDPYALLYGLIYALPFNLSIMLFAFGIAPVITIVTKDENRTQSDNRLAQLITTVLILTALTVTWTITMCEALGMSHIDLHYRYIAALLPIIVALFMKYYPFNEALPQKPTTAQLVLLALSIAGVAAFSGSFGENYLAGEFDYIPRLFSDIGLIESPISEIKGYPTVTLHGSAIVMVSMFSLLSILSIATYKNKKLKKLGSGALVVTLVAMMFVGNMYHTLSNRQVTNITDTEYETLADILKTIDEVSDYQTKTLIIRGGYDNIYHDTNELLQSVYESKAITAIDSYHDDSKCDIEYGIELRDGSIAQRPTRLNTDYASIDLSKYSYVLTTNSERTYNLTNIEPYKQWNITWAEINDDDADRSPIDDPTKCVITLYKLNRN